MKDFRFLLKKLPSIYVKLVAIPIISVILLFSAMKVYFLIAFPTHILKDKVTQFIKENFGKAAIFDDAYITAFGNLVISNLNISISSDFNDNISLVKCPTAEVYLDFFELFSKSLVINKLYFADAEILVYKKYGRNYYDTLNEIFRLDRPLSEISHINRENFSIDIHDSIFEYKEVFRNESLSIRLGDFSLRVNVHGDIVEYRIYGRILPNSNANSARGTIDFTGKMRQEKGIFCAASNSVLQLRNFDLRYVQPYINEVFGDPINVHGKADAHIKFASLGKNISAISKFEITNLSVDKLIEGSKHYYVRNENFNFDFCFDSSGYERLMIKSASLYNDVVNLSLHGIYINNNYEQLLDLVFKTNNINLERFSDHINPFKDTSFKGSFHTNGRLRIDLRSLSAKGSSFFALLDNFGVIARRSSHNDEFMSNCEAKVSLHDDVFDLTAKFSIERSRLVATWCSKIKSWDPFSSETDIRINAPTIDAQHIFYPLMVAVESVYHGAYRDRKVGYENIVFIHEPIGKLLNQNDVRFNFNANEIVCGHRARWNDFSMAASLKGGVFSLDKFTLTGYGAHYDVKSSAQFNLWMPQVSIEATMKDFDLKSFGADAGIKGEVGGVLNASMSFKINAYRLSQILENAILDVDINMIDGMMKNTPFQDALNDFAKKCGIKTPMFSEINGITASVLFNQRADNFSVSRIIFLSDKIRFTGRGRYDFFEGLNVPLEMQFTPTGEHASPSVLLGKIHGPLRKPYLFNTKKQQGKDAFTDATLVLFDIQ